jgi:hypothetical protein
MSTTDTELSHPPPSKQDVSITIGSVDIDPRAERTLVWKLDLRLLPVLAIMYLFNSLDKSNLGNAKTAGLEGTPPLRSVSEERRIDVDYNYRDTLIEGESVQSAS